MNTADTDRTPSGRLWLAALTGAALLYFLAGTLTFEAGVSVARAQMAAGITGFVAVLWLTNAVPLGMASLVPLAAFPMLGVVPISVAAPAYAHPVIWMFFGGFVLALGIERWGLHRRIALGVIAKAGVKPARLVLGFMIAGGFLSMWMNNTSTTLMLLPIALALVKNLAAVGALAGRDEDNFAFALLVGIAYACSIGGMATPIGTAPNALFMTTFAEVRPENPVSFGNWMAVAIPLVWTLIPVTWFLLTRLIAPQGEGNAAGADVIAKERAGLGPMRPAEKRMLSLFALAAVLWVTRRDVNLGSLMELPGWWRLLPVPDANHIGDGAVAIFVAGLSFIIPSGAKPREPLMTWEVARNIPWDILLLIGGGVGIAKAFQATGLAKALALTLEPTLGTVAPWLAIGLVTLMMTFLTEFTSNTASTALLLPVLASSAAAIGQDPRMLMLPATLAASCAFMLPIATPPNAIVFSSGRIPMVRMARTGLLLNFVAIGLVSAAVWFLAMPIWDIAKVF